MEKIPVWQLNSKNNLAEEFGHNDSLLDLTYYRYIFEIVNDTIVS